MVEVPATPDTPWHFLAMTETPPFNHVELAEHVSEPLIGGAKRWVTLQPLPDAEYDLKLE